VKIAALYDIHGNLPALEAVLEEIHSLKVDLILVGGDVFPGPMPVETIETLLQFKHRVRFIRGNGDREVLAQMAGVETDWYSKAPESWREPVRWTAQQLAPRHRALIAKWPATRHLGVSTVDRVLFCHATPASDTEIFTRHTSSSSLLESFDPAIVLGIPTVVCGHTHMPFDRMVADIRVLNAGSVGMPFGRRGADWLLLGPDVEFRHTDYDFDKAAERIRATGYPQGAQFAARNVLNPPSEEEMLAAFQKMEVKGGA